MKRSSFVIGASSFGIALTGRIRARASDEPLVAVMLGSGEAQTLDAATFTFNGRRYRGTFVRRGDGRIITNVQLEQYLYSVVPGEMPHSWPLAALQVQAVCARTFALKRLESKGFDALDASEAGQVYRGIEAEAATTTAATSATAGRVLHFGAGLATIAYSSCCGGHTESAASAWGGSALPYLGGVACTHCADSPNYAWTAHVSRDALETAFGEQVATIRQIDAVRVESVDASGRAETIRLQGPGGEVAVAGKDFRRALGTRVVRSLLLQAIAAAPDGFTVSGRGLGHGVGLCQWGARGFAAAGATMPEILNLYFPGAYVTNN
jgi:stage II sporulation protein D (peptidoglycan lytic transglycosylase)